MTYQPVPQEALAYLIAAKARVLLLAEHIHPNRLTPYPHSCHSLIKRKCRQGQFIWEFSASQLAHAQTQRQPAPVRWAGQGVAWHRGRLPLRAIDESWLVTGSLFLGFGFPPYRFFRMSAPQSSPLSAESQLACLLNSLVLKKGNDSRFLALPRSSGEKMNTFVLSENVWNQGPQAGKHI